MANDLRKGVCPAKLIKCLVIDEAHKATGNHAYCEVCIISVLSYCEVCIIEILNKNLT